MKIELRSFKESPAFSRETMAFVAVLWLDDQRVGEVSSRGDGGALRLGFHPEDQKRLADYCKGLPAIPSPYAEEPLTMNWELYLTLLAGKIADRARVQRRHKAGKMVFTIKGSGGTEWAVVARPYSPEAAAEVMDKNPECGECLNATLDQPPRVYPEGFPQP